MLMRSERQVKIISLQLEILDEFKTQLESVLEITNNAIQKGNSWMKETNDKTFFEMNKFLIDETFECVKRCQDIDKDKNEECPRHTNLEEQDTMDAITKSVNTLKTSKPVGLDCRGENEYKQLFKKCQEMDETISLQSKNFRKLQKQFEKHKNETKYILCRESQEIENKYKSKWNEIWEEFQEASNCMSRLQTENADVNKQMDSLQEQIKEHEQKSETFMKQQKSIENSFSLRLDEIMKGNLENTESVNKLTSDSETLSNVVNEHSKNFDTIIPNLQEKIKYIEEKFKAIESTCRETEESNRMRLDDICTKIQSTELQDKILEVSSQVDNMSKELALSGQHAFFIAQASGIMNVQMDLSEDQIVTSFRRDFTNIGNHYNPRKGIFTAPCDGLYLSSLILRIEIGENVQFGITVKRSNGKVYVGCILETTTVNTSVSGITLLNLKQNDQVYITSLGDYKEIKLHVFSCFTCAFIRKI